MNSLGEGYIRRIQEKIEAHAMECLRHPAQTEWGQGRSHGIYLGMMEAIQLIRDVEEDRENNLQPARLFPNDPLIPQR